MSADDYQDHNIYRYSRKSYKQSKSFSREHTFENSQEDVDQAESPGENVAFEMLDHSPRSVGYGVVNGCLYDLEPEGDMANILHKKCPAITLAQQQLLRVLDETTLPRIPEGRYRALICCLRLWLHKVCLTLAAFFTGLLLGAATCGTHCGISNNPILNYIDNYFISDSYTSIKDTFHSIT